MDQKCKPGKNKKTWLSRVDAAMHIITFHVQHTALLCFISCFNYYISITTDMKTPAISAPLPIKASVTERGLKVEILPAIHRSAKFLASDTRQSWLPSHPSAAQPGPHPCKSCLLLQGPMPQPITYPGSGGDVLP